jgi:hypothetical protein
MAEEKLKQVAIDLATVVATMVKNYVGFTISEGLTPVFMGAIKDMLDDAQSELKPKEVSMIDKLKYECHGVDEPGMFTMEVEDMDYKSRGSWSWFATYPVTCVRVGKAKKDGRFFVLGKEYRVRYGILQRAIEKVRDEEKDQKDAKKIEDLPAEPIWGYVCCCIEKHDSESVGSSQMRSYWAEFVKDHNTSKALADWFYLGDDFEAQQRSRRIFMLAYQATKLDVMRGNYFVEHLKPFNEGEAVTILLQNYAKQFIQPELYQLVPEIPVCRWRLLWGMDSAVEQAIEVAMKAWDPVQDKVNEAGKFIQKEIDNGADKLVEAFKPLLAKVLGIVKEQLKSDDKSKDEKDDKKEVAIGDIIADWTFAKTEIGTKFSSSLNKASAKSALADIEGSLADSIKVTLEEKIDNAVKSALGAGKGGGMQIVALVVEAVAGQIGKIIRRFTSAERLLRAAGAMFVDLEALEKDLCAKKSSKEDAVKVINEASGKMWKTLAPAGLRMYRNFRSLHKDIKSDLSGVCDEAVDPLLDLVDYLFIVQMRVLNAVRVVFTENLKAKIDTDNILASDESVVAAVRSVFAASVFEHIDLLTRESWTATAAALIASALGQVLDIFNKKVWPVVVKPLEALQNMVPEALSKAGLNIPPIALQICTMLITKGVTGVLTKLILAFEKALFVQS